MTSLLKLSIVVFSLFFLVWQAILPVSSLISPAQAEEAETEPSASKDDSSAEPSATKDADAASSAAPAATADTPDTAETAESPAIPADDAKARATLSKARDRLISYNSVRATIKETVSIGDRQFTANGTYLRGENLKLRLEINIKLPEDDAISGSLLQVCDGQILWTQHSIGEKRRVERRDVREILTAAEKSGSVDRNVMVADLSLGGIPALLASLEQAMTFRSIREETISDKTFTVIEGSWNERIMAGFKQTLGTTDRLPAHIPDLVRIYLEPENLFPRRIRYLKRHPTRESMRPLVTLDFKEIMLNSDVSNEEFQFVPEEGDQPRDVTNAFLQQLQNATQQRTQGAPQQPGAAPAFDPLQPDKPAADATK